VVLPSSALYTWWYRLTVLAAILTALVEPYCFAFVDSPSLAPYNSNEAIMIFILIIIFSIDIAINFFLAYVDKEQRRIVVDLGKIRWRYMTFLFWIDLIALLPWDLIIMSGLGLIGITTGQHPGTMLPSYLAILKWLSLLRLYRVYRAFTLYMEFDLRLNHLFITIFRNQLYVAFLLHWCACWWFWLARINHFGIDPSNPSWIITASTLQDRQTSLFQDYVASLYFVTVSFATVGYGDIIAQNTQEYIFIICMILVFIIVSAYILGTITMLVVKADEKQREFRIHSKNLTRYNEKKKIPVDLRDSMKDHLALYLDHNQVRDEAVLQIYPTTIKRRVLRHCYLDLLNRCYLFKHTPHKFKDVLLTSARIETFLPNDEILQDGDFSQDISIIVGGAAVSRVFIQSEDHSLSDEDTSVAGSPASKVKVKILKPGDSFGEICELYSLNHPGRHDSHISVSCLQPSSLT
jgi:hypothetical protein